MANALKRRGALTIWFDPEIVDQQGKVTFPSLGPNIL